MIKFFADVALGAEICLAGTFFAGWVAWFAYSVYWDVDVCRTGVFAEVVV